MRYPPDGAREGASRRPHGRAASGRTDQGCRGAEAAGAAGRGGGAGCGRPSEAGGAGTGGGRHNAGGAGTTPNVDSAAVHLNQLNLAGPGTFATRIERGAGAQTYVAFDVHNSAGTANV